MIKRYKRDREEILQAIANERAKLAELEQAQLEVRGRIAELEREVTPDTEVVDDSETPFTPAEKVILFRSLFRGREDIFPIRFTNNKTGKSGYSPVCANKWEPGLCLLKTGGKCGECPNQLFHPVSDRAIFDHLQGRHVMGVYPLLSDETCWFLAVDFDKDGWDEDVSAFREICDRLELPVAIERSRSGNGAHAWLFFHEPVLASVARTLGCYLITETMNYRHELMMGSYDRLFPNQDTMPRGGFGNLIALPLQYEPRQKGNSVFVDQNLKAYDDQWAFLASVKRIKTSVAEDVVREARQTGEIVGVRSANPEEFDLSKPWDRKLLRDNSEAGSLQKEISCVLAQRLFIEKTGLPSRVITELKRLSAFQNPEFYRKQKMRMSTALTPRVVACSEELPLHLALPRGCASEAKQLLADFGGIPSVDDQRYTGEFTEHDFYGELTTVQQDAAQSILAHDIGVFVGPPGIGKTVLGTYLVAKRACSTLILVHRRPLLEQWTAQLSMFLGLTPSEIGQIGGGKRKPNGQLDVAMMQSIVRQNSVDNLVATYGHVIVDECHHVPAFSFERVLSEVKAKYILGLTATPRRRDGHHPIIQMQLGPVRYEVDEKNQKMSRPYSHKLIVRETEFSLENDADDLGIQDIYGVLSRDEARNETIVDDVLLAIDEGRSPILLTERKEHLEYFADKLRGFVRHIVVLQGGMTTKKRRAASEQLASIGYDEERLVIATGRYIGEGFDDARLDTLFLAMPISWKGTLIQYSGRLHRHYPGKKEVRIYDYVDRNVPMLARMFEKRLNAYRAIGYTGSVTQGLDLAL